MKNCNQKHRYHFEIFLLIFLFCMCIFFVGFVCFFFYIFCFLIETNIYNNILISTDFLLFAFLSNFEFHLGCIFCVVFFSKYLAFDLNPHLWGLWRYPVSVALFSALTI